MRRVYTLQDQGGFTLGALLDKGRGFEDKSPVQSTDEGSQKSQGMGEERRGQIGMTVYKGTEEIQLREICSKSRVYIPETQRSLEQLMKQMEADGMQWNHEEVHMSKQE